MIRVFAILISVFYRAKLKHGDGRSYVLTVLLKMEALLGHDAVATDKTEIFVGLPYSIFRDLGLFGLSRL
jgi:hypothetical protein